MANDRKASSPDDRKASSGSAGPREAADRGPGAHSGREQQPKERTVHGTASAAEGYSPHGTGEGEALKGREKDDTEDSDNP